MEAQILTQVPRAISGRTETETQVSRVLAGQYEIANILPYKIDNLCTSV